MFAEYGSPTSLADTEDDGIDIQSLPISHEFEYATIGATSTEIRRLDIGIVSELRLANSRLLQEIADGAWG